VITSLSVFADSTAEDGAGLALPVDQVHRALGASAIQHDLALIADTLAINQICIGVQTLMAKRMLKRTGMLADFAANSLTLDTVPFGIKGLELCCAFALIACDCCPSAGMATLTTCLSVFTNSTAEDRTGFTLTVHQFHRALGAEPIREGLALMADTFAINQVSVGI
jgi:ABC-type sulfate transport system substrate-binding protein